MKNNDIKQLLIKLRDDISHRGVLGGLCNHLRLTVSFSEYRILFNYFENKLPNKKDKYGYCWEHNLTEPRIEWLNEQIEKLENETRGNTKQPN